MSTKGTIARGETWHLYEEMLEDAVCISTEGEPFEATCGSVRVQLPTRLIDAIRKAPDAAFPHLRTPNAELQRAATR